MGSRHWLVALCATVMTAGCVPATLRGETRPGDDPDLALVGGTIYTSPTAAPITDGVVLVRDGAIVRVGRAEGLDAAAARHVLDCSGLVISAAFWNSHVHFFERKWQHASDLPSAELARQLHDVFTRYGFTNVFDTGSPWANTCAIRERVESGEIDGPRIRTTGEPLVAPGAMPSARVLGVLGIVDFPAPEVSTPAQVAAASRRLLEGGVDALKIHLQPPPPPEPCLPTDAIAIAVAEAQRCAKPVFVHPHTNEDVLVALHAGVDVIAHTTPHGGPWDAALRAAARDSRAALTPTLTLWKHATRHDRVSVQERTVGVAVDQLRAWIAEGGAVLFGNDAGVVPDDPADEYALMAEAGMSFRQVLAALTTTPAKRFAGTARLGTIATGLPADLVAFRAAATEDVRALADVRYTLRDGVVIHRDDGRAESSPSRSRPAR